MKTLLINLLLNVTFIGVIHASDLEIDLNGFRLQQFTSVVESALGARFQTVDLGDKVAYAYGVDDNSYMLIYENRKFPNYIDALQLTGTSSKALSFKGLTLGNSKSKVISVLGEPDEINETEISGLFAYHYEKRNYSVEIDKNNKLYSIRIFTTNYLVNKIDDSSDVWLNFEKVINSNSTEQLLTIIRPDIEVFIGSETYSINTKYSDFTSNPRPKFVKSFFGDNDSVKSAIMNSSPIDEHVRLIKDFGIGLVFKFSEKSILNELVFFPYNGKYRLYEVSFRKKNQT